MAEPNSDDRISNTLPSRFPKSSTDASVGGPRINSSTGNLVDQAQKCRLATYGVAVASIGLVSSFTAALMPIDVSARPAKWIVLLTGLLISGLGLLMQWVPRTTSTMALIAFILGNGIAFALGGWILHFGVCLTAVLLPLLILFTLAVFTPPVSHRPASRLDRPNNFRTSPPQSLTLPSDSTDQSIQPTSRALRSLGSSIPSTLDPWKEAFTSATPRESDPSFVGGEIIDRRPLSRVAILALVCGAVLVCIGAIFNLWVPAFAISSICLSLFAVFAIGWLFPLRFVITSDAIVSGWRRRSWDFRDIFAVRAGPTDATGRFPIFIYHRQACLEFGNRLNCDSRELFIWLQAKTSQFQRVAEVPNLLDAYHRRQQSRHPLQSIHVFHYLPRPKPPNPAIPIFKLSLAFLFSPLALLFLLRIFLVGTATNVPDWVVVSSVFSSIVIGIGLLVCTAFLYLNRRGIDSAFKGACLIVSPEGCAMNQGATWGEMRWSDVLAARIQRSTLGDFYQDNAAGIYFDVGSGARVHVADTYEIDLEELARLVENYGRFRIDR